MTNKTLRDYINLVENAQRESVAEGRFDEPLTGWHIVYRSTGNLVHATPSFETKEQAQKYLMTRMFANHQDYKVVHTAGVAEGADEGLSKYSTERLQAYVKKVSGGGVPAFGSGAKLKRVQAELKRREQALKEMDKSAPQPGRDGRVSHSTYGSRDKGGKTGKQIDVKPVKTGKAKQDALKDLNKAFKKNISEGVMDQIKNIYMSLVNDAPMGTPESEFLAHWQQIIQDELGKRIDIDTLARLRDNFVGRYKSMSRRGDVGDWHREMGQDLEEGLKFHGGFPDVDHMRGAVHRDADMITDNVKTNNKKDWDRAVDSINTRVFDDMAEFRTDSKGERVVGNSAVWAKWDNETQTGWFNVKGRPLKPWPVKEQGVAEGKDNTPPGSYAWKLGYKRGMQDTTNNKPVGSPAYKDGWRAAKKQKQQGVAEDQLEETSPDAIEKIEQLVRK